MPATEAQRALGKQGGRNVLYLDYFSGNPGIYICQNLKWVLFIMCKLQLEKLIKNVEKEKQKNL